MASTGASEEEPGQDPGTTLDRLLGGRLVLRQPRRGFRAGQDALLLAAAVPARPGQSALELGCGAGAAILALGVRVPDLRLEGLELQAPYAALARANARANGLALAVHEGDVAAPPDAIGGRAFDHVLMNPPYFDRRASTRAGDGGRDLAHGGPAPLAAWLALAARRLGDGGRLTLIQRTARLPEILAGLPRTMGGVEALPLAPRAGRAPDLLVLRARKGGRAPFRLLPPLALHAGESPGGARDGAPHAPSVQAVLRDGAPLPWGGQETPDDHGGGPPPVRPRRRAA